MLECPWGGYEPAAISFCEQRLCGWVVEPANTWSNIGYLIIGVCVFLSARKHGRGELLILGITSVLVGIGSFLFHATGTRWGEILDVSAMYLISSTFITFGSSRIWPLSKSGLTVIYTLTALLSIAFLVLSSSNGILLFAAHLTAAGIFEIMYFRRAAERPDYRELKRVAIAFAVAYVAWVLDVRHIICDPNNHIFGGHAVWHLSNSTCMWFYYRYQRQFKAAA